MIEVAHRCQVVGGLRLRPLAVGVVLAAIEVTPAALVLGVPIVVCCCCCCLAEQRRTSVTIFKQRGSPDNDLMPHRTHTLPGPWTLLHSLLDQRSWAIVS